MVVKLDGYHGARIDEPGFFGVGPGGKHGVSYDRYEECGDGQVLIRIFVSDSAIKKAKGNTQAILDMVEQERHVLKNVWKTYNSDHKYSTLRMEADGCIQGLASVTPKHKPPEWESIDVVVYAKAMLDNKDKPVGEKTGNRLKKILKIYEAKYQAKIEDPNHQYDVLGAGDRKPGHEQKVPKALVGIIGQASAAGGTGSPSTPTSSTSVSAASPAASPEKAPLLSPPVEPASDDL